MSKQSSRRKNPSKRDAPEPPPAGALPRWMTLLLLALSLVALAGVLAVTGYLPLDRLTRDDDVPPQYIYDPGAPLADFYTPEVFYWRDRIYAWAEQYTINPNVIAILMQIESCGSPDVLSEAGANGLMQVMPFHFDDGENMLNPDTNVRHGVRILRECLEVFANGDLGVAAACYNGGPSVTQRPQDTWPAETRSYYKWATGLWRDVVNGEDSSDTLRAWLAAGGSRLCAIAAADQQPPTLVAPTQAVGPLAAPS